MTETPAVPEAIFSVAYAGADDAEHVERFRGAYSWTPDVLRIVGVRMNHHDRETKIIEFLRTRVLKIMVTP